MKARLLLSIFLMFSLISNGQLNLVPNPGFEDSISCQTFTGTSYRPSNWYSAVDGTPDYFLVSQGMVGCTDSFPDTWGAFNYNNQWGYQLPRSGKGYAGFIYAQFSENIGVKLLEPLELGKQYEISCYVSLANNYAYQTIDLIQFDFTANANTSYTSQGGQGYFDSFVPDCGNQQGNFIVDTMGWTLVKDTFIAVGGEVYLTVGNFDIQNTQYFVVDSSTQFWGYFYFDDFDVHCIDCTSDTSEPPVFPIITITPTLTQGEITVSGDFPAGTKLEVFDVLGQLVYYDELQSGNQTQTVFLQLSAGVYTCRVMAEGNVLKTEKVVITK